MFKKILVPLDGSELAESALAVAAMLTEQHDGELLLVQALSYPIMVSPEIAGYAAESVYSMVEHRISAETYLNEIAERYAGLPIQIEAISDTPAAAILDQAEANSADLIVMSTHGRSGLGRWMFGSVTEKVLRYAHCPVLAVRSAEIPHNFLLPLDGSELSERAIEPTFALAEAFDATVTLAHVQDTRELMSPRELAELAALDSGFAERVKLDFYSRGENYLSSIVQRYADRNLSIDIAFGRGNPAQYILELAERDGSDLIAMSTHGRSGINRFRYGSVTEKVLRHNERAMFIIRAETE